MSEREDTVYVVDDDQDFRESLAWLLESAGHKAVCFASAEIFLAELDTLSLDSKALDPEAAEPEAAEQNAAEQNAAACLLLDVRMTGMSGLALQQRLNERALQQLNERALPVIMMTGHGDIAMAVQAMKNQAVDFIEKPFDDEVLLALLDETLAKAKSQQRQQGQQLQLARRWQSLSKRERQVAELVVSGKVNRETAAELGISIKTVEIHRSRVMSKLQVKNVAELVSLAGSFKGTAEKWR